jgi:hypothetical protein
MGIMNWRTVALLAVFVVPHAAHAQGLMTGTLRGVKRVTCTFPVLAIGTWDANGVPTAQVKETPLTVSYDAIDTDEGTARFNGPFGDLAIIARVSTWSLHLLEIGSEGTLRLTTVFDRESGPGKLKAAHTIHEFTPVGLPGFASRPEQHYGECEVGR